MSKATATIGDLVIAKSDNTIKVEGSHYFPEADVQMDLLTPTDQKTVCHWKGDCNYYTITANGKDYSNAAWTYHNPITDRAMPIKDYVAFYPNIVQIEEQS